MRAPRPLSMRFVFKFAMPVFGIVWVALLSWGNPMNLWVVLPGALTLVYFTAAELRIRNGRVRYRRVFTWKDLPDDVNSAACLPLPALGFIAFRHYLPPFGVLLYIVERDEGPFRPFNRTNLMQALVSSGRGFLDTALTTQAGSFEAPHRADLRWPLVAAASMLAGALVPQPHHSPRMWTGFFRVFWDVVQLLNQPLPSAACAVVLAWILIRRRLQGPLSALLAFLFGGIVAHLVRLL